MQIPRFARDDKPLGVLALMHPHSPGGFRKNLLRNFAQRYMKLKHRRFRTAPPPCHVPVCADKLDLRPRREIQQQRNFLAIELLRESDDRFGIPRRAIRRPVYADVRAIPAQ